MVNPNIPTPFTVVHRPFLTSSRGGAVFGAPVERRVYGWRQPGSKDGEDARVVSDLELGAPLFPVQPRDEFDIPGEGTLVVAAARRNNNTGPFGFEPGMVVPLRRVDG